MATHLKKIKLTEVVFIPKSKIKKFFGEKDYIATSDIDINKITGSERVTYENRPSRAALLMTENDVLFAKMKNTVKVLTGSRDTEAKIFSTGFYILRPKKDVVKEFLYFFFLTDYFNKQKNLFCTGATMSGLNNTGLRKIEIPIPVNDDGKPDLDEQARIVKTLKEIELLKEKRAEADKKMLDIIPAVYSKIIKGEKNINDKVPFSKIFNITTGKLNANAANLDGKYPFFTCSREDYKIDTYAFDCEALILSGNNATADYSIKHHKGKFNAYQRTYILTLKNSSDSYYLFKFLLENQLQTLKKNSIGSNTKYLTLGILNKLKFFVPNPEEQEQFTQIAKKVEAHKKEQERLKKEIARLYQSALVRSFSGKL